MAQPSEESPYRLLVEGLDDKHSVIHLLKRHGFNWDDETTVRPYIQDANGVERLLQQIPVTLKGRYERVGIVLDANSDLAARWRQVRDRARKAGLNLPDSPHPDGTLESGRPRIGVWLMPDNVASGALETFLGKLVPPGDLWTYAGEVTNEARQQRGAPCLEKDHAKSSLYTWLAWQEKPGLPFGTALKGGLFEAESEEALRFVAWFHRLFVEA